MAKHLNTLEKEFLIRQYKGGRQKLSDFCEKNGISTGAFQTSFFKGQPMK